MHQKHKILISISLVLAVFFGYLFLVDLLELREQILDEKIEALIKEETVIVPAPAEIPEEGVVDSPDSALLPERIILPIKPVLYEYMQIVDSCGPYFEELCVRARSGPGTDFPVVTKLRNGIILKVGGFVSRSGQIWYKVVFDEKLRYPDRVKSDLFVVSDYVTVLFDEGIINAPLKSKTATDTALNKSTKRILVSRSKQTLEAYDGEDLFMQSIISTGVELTPTPKGTFTIYRKTPTRYMQGPLPGVTTQYWDLPGVPWNLYFTQAGDVIHGAYWHDNFGKPSSRGCVNMRPDEAEKLYKWAEIGTKVIVTD